MCSSVLLGVLRVNLKNRSAVPREEETWFVFLFQVLCPEENQEQLKTQTLFLCVSALCFSWNSRTACSVFLGGSCSTRRTIVLLETRNSRAVLQHFSKNPKKNRRTHSSRRARIRSMVLLVKQEPPKEPLLSTNHCSSCLKKNSRTVLKVYSKNPKNNSTILLAVLVVLSGTSETNHCSSETNR